MKHPCIPVTLTVENRAQWIKDNAIETIEHIEKTELDEEQIIELQAKSSLASRGLDRLEEVKKEFLDYLKEGTPAMDGDYQPIAITIPPTKGTKALKANRAFADKQLENGFKEENVTIYIIPFPEDSLMVALDIEGNEWPQFTKDMTMDQINQHKPMLKRDKKEKVEKKKEDNFMEDEEEEISSEDLNL